MFNSSKKAATIDPNAISINIISKGTEILGDISSQGDMRIEGIVKGSLLCKARIVIGDSGEVKGNITANDAVISGTVIGNVMVSEFLFLKGTAKIFGDLVVGKIVVENGAEFNGSCKMNSELEQQVTKQDGAKAASQK
jgi:cytoskeletal protein CcmA (bactofilin family)